MDIHPHALPNAKAAVIPPEKIAGYVLNPEHETGQHKARVFLSVLGITRENAQLLHAAILKGVQTCPAIPKHADKHGQRYEVDLPVIGPVGSAMVRTGWIIPETGAAPRLTSAYVKETR